MPSRFPDFIIGGAPRSGTSWLYSVLDRHPDISMAKPIRPEPKFFLVDDLYSRGIDYYRKHWFADLENTKIAGEKSANYLENPRVAERIKECLPGIKLIFILRDPVQRAFSNYLWSKQNGLETEDFEMALALEETRQRELSPDLRYSRPHAYFSRGLYAQELRPYFERFPRENIFCGCFEDISEDEAAVAAQVHKFLGVSERHSDGIGLGAVNQIVDKKSAAMDPRVREKLARAYEGPNRELTNLLGSDFIKHWRS